MNEIWRKHPQAVAEQTDVKTILWIKITVFNAYAKSYVQTHLRGFSNGRMAYLARLTSGLDTGQIKH